MFRRCLAASVREASKRSVVSERRERLQRENIRFAEVEAEYRNTQSDLLCQIGNLREELKTAEGTNVSLSREMQDLQAQLAAAQQLAEEMEQQVHTVQTLHESKSRQLEKDTQEQLVRYEETKKSCQSLKAQLTECEQRLATTAALEQKYNTLSQQHADLTEQYEILIKQREGDSKRHSMDLEKKYEKLLQAQEQLIVDKKLQKAETEELQSKYGVLKASHENNRKINERLEERLIENENFLRTREGQIAARFEAQVAEARCECAQTAADRDDFEAALQACQKQLQSAREQNAKLRAYFEENDDGDKENQASTANAGFFSNALGQARRTLQGHYK